MLPTSASDTSYSPPAYLDEPHLDLPTAFSTLTCLQRGLCPLRGPQGPKFLKSHSLYYEIHGSPATVAASIASPPHTGDDEVKKKDCVLLSRKKLKNNKMVFIMGLNASCFSWDPQVRWFGSGVLPCVAGAGDDDEEEEYTALVFDNRGVGNSGYPRGPYT